MTCILKCNSTGGFEKGPKSRNSGNPQFTRVKFAIPYTDQKKRKLWATDPICTFCANHPSSGRLSRGLEGGVDGCRIGFSAGLFHHLTDEPGGEFRFGFHLFHLVGIGGDHRIDRRFDGAGVGHLLQAARLDDRCAGSPPSLHTISRRSLAILPEMVPSAIIWMMALLAAALHRHVARWTARRG